MELLELLQKRRSIRKYTGEHIPEDKLERILQAGLLAPSSRAIYPVEFVVTGDKEKLRELSQCKVGSAAMLADADAAIIVIGDTEKSDAWIEDCSIAMILMQLEAAELGVGSCWVQCRGRTTPQGTGTEDHIKSLFGIPENYGVLAVLSLGMPCEEPAPYELPDVKNEKLHYEVKSGE